MRRHRIRFLKHVVGSGLIVILVFSSIMGIALGGDLLQIINTMLTFFGILTAALSAIGLFLSVYRPTLRKEIMGDFGWGDKDDDEGVYPVLPGLTPNTAALIAPLSSSNDLALFLINHGIKPKTVELVYSPETAKNSATSPIAVFDRGSRLPDGRPRFKVPRDSIADEPVDYLDFQILYRRCCTKIAGLKEDFSSGDIYVDTTAGTAVLSMAFLQAAMHEDVNAIYIKGTAPNPRGSGMPVVKADDPQSGKIILVHDGRHSGGQPTV